MIGVVVGKTVEHYKVDIGTAQPALLGVLAFEGATKRNKPNHNVRCVFRAHRLILVA